MDEKAFEEALKKTKIPILVLDQKWHRLFAISGKPDDVKQIEEEINELLARQGKLQEEIGRLKKIKADLMQTVVDNMGGADSENDDEAKQKSLDEAKRLLEETNARLEDEEDELLEIPGLIKEKNGDLMVTTMRFIYGKLRSNTDEINQISNWIKEVRVNLKKNIIKKQNREINNKEMYSYMHDVFGTDAMRMFDAHFDNDGKLILKEHLEEEQIRAARGEKLEGEE